MDKKLIQAKIDAALAAIDAIFTKADAEQRALTAEELAEVSRLEGEHDDAKQELANAELAEKNANDARQRQEARRKEANKPQPRKSTASQPGAPTNTDPQFVSDPKKGFKDHREFLGAILDSARHNAVTDERLRYMAVGSDEAGTYSDPYGNFLVPSGFLPNVMSLSPESDPTAGRTTAVPARVDKNHTSSVSGGLRVYRTMETDDAPSSRIEFEKVQLNAHALNGVAYATEQLLSRSPMSFVALLDAGFKDEFGAKLLKEKLFGTGAGEYEGVVNGPCVVSVAKESGQAAATLVYENVIKMRSRVWRYSDAIWLANHDTLPQLMKMSVSVGTGGSAMIWQASARDGEPDTLLGRPIYFIEFCKTLGTTGDILCCNWSQYLEGTLTPMQSAESMHVRFLQHERTFKFWTENDGRCWWRSALTPNQSSSTLSPFVKLDARA
jgi:HK97 family phage major capsid protein